MTINGSDIRMIRGDTEQLVVTCQLSDGTERPFEEGDTVTLTYSVADNFGGLARSEAVDSPITVELQENQRGDERYEDWSIPITDGNDAINLYPFGAETTSGGLGSGMCIEGCWLTKN